jgi:hypothetical protein
MSDMNAQDAAAPSTNAMAATPAPETPPAERVVVVTGNPSGTVVTDTGRDAVVKAAVQESVAASKAHPTPTPAAGGPPTMSPGQFAPLSAPPLPISLSKEQRLSELLRQYQLDQISPEQYHEQRAKILAEP